MGFRLENLMVESRLHETGFVIALDDCKRPVVAAKGIPMPMTTFVWLLMERISTIGIGDDEARSRREDDHTNAIKDLWGDIPMPSLGKYKKGTPTTSERRPLHICRQAVTMVIDDLLQSSNVTKALSEIIMDLDEKYRRLVIQSQADSS